jgi:hypothetical protein
VTKNYTSVLEEISRNTVAKYCEGDAVPWERKVPEERHLFLRGHRPGDEAYEKVIYMIYLREYFF